MLIFAVTMWMLDHYLPLVAIIPEPWRWLGWCVMAIAPVAPIMAFTQFRRAHTTVDPRKPETATALVTSGVYKWTRNPMYLGLFILLLGWAIKLGTFGPLIVALLFLPLIYKVQIRVEEHALREQFGADYDRYCEQVGRWIGRR
jgi:protein-S-isoprenylcysteine O-methyltransferase Ste14